MPQPEPHQANPDPRRKGETLLFLWVNWRGTLEKKTGLFLGDSLFSAPRATCLALASEQEDSERGGKEGLSYRTHLPSALNLLNTPRLSNQLQPPPRAGVGAWVEEHGGEQREEIQRMKRIQLPAHLYKAE